MGNRLTGKVAICTGGAQGIGLGTAERFLEEGAKVVLADVNQAVGDAAVARLGKNAAFKLTDVSSEAQVQALVDFAVETFGGLDIMFNNAGISGARHARLFDEDFADFHRVLDINLLGVMMGTKIAARYMADHGGGSIINTTSIAAMTPSAAMINYHVSKVGVLMFSQGAALDLGEYGIRVNCIAPGNIETPILGETMGQGFSEADKIAMLAKTRAFLIDRQPMKRQGLPSDIAALATFLASDESSFITGTHTAVDGGQVVGTPPSKGSGIEKMREEVRAASAKEAASA